MDWSKADESTVARDSRQVPPECRPLIAPVSPQRPSLPRVPQSDAVASRHSLGTYATCQAALILDKTCLVLISSADRSWKSATFTFGCGERTNVEACIVSRRGIGMTSELYFGCIHAPLIDAHPPVARLKLEGPTNSSEPVRCLFFDTSPTRARGKTDISPIPIRWGRVHD